MSVGDMSRRSRSRPLLMLLLLLLLLLPAATPSVPATSNVKLPSAVKRLLRQVVTEAVRKHCPGPNPAPAAQQAGPQDPHWRCSCPSGFIPCAGRCYAPLHSAVEYEQAERDCAAIGAHLAVPRSREQNLCVAGLAGLQHAWLGVTDRKQEGRFFGADGRAITNDGHVWGRNQPDNYYGREDCVQIIGVYRRGFNFAEWNDEECFGVTCVPMCQLPDYDHDVP